MIFQKPLLCLFVLSVVLLQGCDAGGVNGEGTRYEVRDSAGTSIVLNGPIGTLGADTLSLVEDLRIGVVEGEDPYQFYQVEDLAMDGMGTLFVGNTMTGTVRVFSPEGEFIREFGGKGEGPGEVSMVNQLWLTGDSVVVVDWQRGGKTIVFTKTGDLVSSWRSMQPDNSRISPAGFGPGGWVGFSDPPFSRELRQEVQAGEPQEQTRDLLRIFPEADSVGDVYVKLPTRVLYGTGSGQAVDWGLFEYRSQFDWDGGGNLFLSRGHPYQVDVFDSYGKLIRSIRRDYEAVVITEEDVAAVIERLPSPLDTISWMPSEGERERQKEQAVERVKRQASFPRPDTLGCLGRILVAHDGAFWVERADALPPVESEMRRWWAGFGDSSENISVWDVFDGGGAFLGRVKLPPRFGPMAVTARSVVGVLKDSLDVEYVVRFRVTSNQTSGSSPGEG